MIRFISKQKYNDLNAECKQLKKQIEEQNNQCLECHDIRNITKKPFDELMRRKQLRYELNDFLKSYKKSRAKTKPVHYFIRRFENITAMMAMVGLGIVLFEWPFLDLGGFSREWLILIDEPYSPAYYFLSFPVMIAIGIILNFFNWLTNRLTLIGLAFSQFVSLFIFEPISISSTMLVWGVTLFVLAHGMNRKQGYSRRWSRCSYFIARINILLKELEHDLDTPENIRSKFYEFWEEASATVHKDLMGDYVDYGNAALKTLNFNKPK